VIAHAIFDGTGAELLRLPVSAERVAAVQSRVAR
jgi:hypothetical protein